jgi:hypothetical protein
MRVLLSIEETRYDLFGQCSHDLLEAEVGVTLSHPSEVLAVLIGETVKDQGCQLVHTLTVGVLLVAFEEDVYDAGETVVVVGLMLLLVLGKVDLGTGHTTFLHGSVDQLDLELLLEEFAVGFGAFGVLLY